MRTSMTSTPIALSLLAGLVSSVVVFPAIAQAADIACDGVMFGDTDFTAYYGETGFGRIVLTDRRTRTPVEVPLQYVGLSAGQAIFRGNNPEQTSDVVVVEAPRQVTVGSTIVASYNGNRFTGRCRSNMQPERPPTVQPPIEGNFSGLGTASNRVFTPAEVNASLSYNQTRRFSLSLGQGTQRDVMYMGNISSLSTRGNNPNSFVLQGTVNSFASSANGRRPINTNGNCTIEVFDSRIVSASCSAGTPNWLDGSVQFRGRSQF